VRTEGEHPFSGKGFGRRGDISFLGDHVEMKGEMRRAF
jgi:hypothetical protein